MSNKQRKREVARIYQSTLRIIQIADDIANAAHNPNHRIAMGALIDVKNAPSPTSALRA
jgi:hypothetical protein